LREIILSVTNRCNLRCAMCQIPEMEDGNEMSTAQLKGVIRDSLVLGPDNVVFSGGEPLLRDDILELISFASGYKINTCLTSNGTLITEGMARKLSSCGIGVVNVSIEGPEEIHDSLRGKGSFKKAEEALKNLLRNKIEATIATVVCRDNYQALPFIMELAHRFSVNTVKFQPFSDIFLMDKERKRRFIFTEDIRLESRKIIEQVIDLACRYKVSTNPDSYLRSIPDYLGGYRQAYHPDGCPALRYSCPITCDGRVLLCWVLSDKSIGSVKQGRIYSLWNSARHNRLRRAAIKNGCAGCLMSCYDYNPGQGKHRSLLHLARKPGQLRKPGLYKNQYYRFYRWLRYISGKLTNPVYYGLSIKGHGHLEDGEAGAIEEINSAQEILKDKIREIRGHA